MSKPSGTEACVCGHSAWLHNSYAGACYNTSAANPAEKCPCDGFRVRAVADLRALEPLERAASRWNP